MRNKVRAKRELEMEWRDMRPICDVINREDCNYRDNVAPPLAANGRLSGNQGGCPPDEVAIVDVMAALERPGSPVSPNLQPALKKGHSVEVSMMVEDTPTEVMQDMDGRMGDLSPAMLHSEAKDPSRPIPSFK
ncbi:hypothetical protein V6N13_025273 [Hibiscus sabdariffa]